VLERWDTTSLTGPYKLRITLKENPVGGPSPEERPESEPAPEPRPSEPRTKVIEIHVVVDYDPPKIEITSPRDGAEIKDGQKVLLKARASDNHRIAMTDFYVDGRSIGSSPEAEAFVEWTATPGPHIVRAVTRDIAGNEASSNEVKITVR
jgi:hypothetical protein